MGIKNEVLSADIAWPGLCVATWVTSCCVESVSVRSTIPHLSNMTPSRLRKGSKEREVQAGENFSYIASFSHKLYRITVSQISPKARLKGRDMKRLWAVGHRQIAKKMVFLTVGCCGNYWNHDMGDVDSKSPLSSDWWRIWHKRTDVRRNRHHLLTTTSRKKNTWNNHGSRSSCKKRMP